jgi:hypothetical protein
MVYGCPTPCGGGGWAGWGRDGPGSGSRRRTRRGWRGWLRLRVGAMRWLPGRWIAWTPGHAGPARAPGPRAGQRLSTGRGPWRRTSGGCRARGLQWCLRRRLRTSPPLGGNGPSTGGASRTVGDRVACEHGQETITKMSNWRVWNGLRAVELTGSGLIPLQGS